jgi:hypothetical protein
MAAPVMRVRGSGSDQNSNEREKGEKNARQAYGDYGKLRERIALHIESLR